jgi:putative ABC transport system permease protein
MLHLTLRNLMARKVRLLMSTLAIVLGVGFLAGVMTFSNGLGNTFDGIIKGSTPEARVQPKGELAFSNANAALDSMITPEDVAKIAALPEVEKASGSVDGMGAYLLGTNGKLVGGQGAPTLVFNYEQSNNMLGEPILQLEKGDWPTADGQVVLDQASADRGKYDIGDEVSLIVPNAASVQDATRKFELVGTANFNGGGTAGAILVLMDTKQAQDVFLGGLDAFTSVSLTGKDGVSQKELAAAANTVVPDGFTAVTGDKLVKESEASIGQFLDVISIFLTAFAVIAIVVGAFIIFNTFSILVQQRVRESALLRALGASRKQVTRSVLIEALLMALVGATLGVLLGLLLARGLAAVFQMVGLEISGDTLSLTPGTVIWAYVVGLLVTMAAAYLPARRASKVPPVAAMREDVEVQEKGMRRRTIVGVVALLIGAALAAVGLVGGPGNDAIWIGAAAIIWIVTGALIAPVLGKPLLLGLRGVFGKVFGASGRLAGENALRNPRRTGATASALMIGLAVVSAVGVLASSVSATNDKLINDQFSSDFLVQSPTFGAFPTAIGDDMAKVDGVAVVSRQQGVVALSDDGSKKPKQEYVIGVDSTFPDIYKLTMLSGTQRLTGHEVLLNKSKAKALDLKVGGTLPLEFPSGKTLDLKVAGIFDDTPVTGSITAPLSVLKAAGIKRADQALSINADKGADKAEVAKALDAVIADIPIVAVQDKQQFADSIKGQLNQLLYMIYGLLALAIIIAVFGIINTLGLSVLERTREIGLLRAVGLSRSRLRLMVMLESVTIALLGAALGLGVGLVIGILLRQSLKKDLTVLALPLSSLVVFLIIAVILGVLAAIVPAIRASRMNVLQAIATE